MSTSIYQMVNRQPDADPDDYYATDPKAARDLLRVEQTLDNIWEPACGEGHLAKVFDQLGKLGRATDLVDRGYGEMLDFLSRKSWDWKGDIVTNPPYSRSGEFVLRAIKSCWAGRKVAMLLPLTFLETAVRYDNLFAEHPPLRIWVYSKRLMCAKNGDFAHARKINSMKCYAWFVWVRGTSRPPEIHWIRW